MTDKLEMDPRFEILTLDEYRILEANPYEGPHVAVRGTREVKIAQALVERGLLERDPTVVDSMIVRVTGRGEQVLIPLTRSMARRAVVRFAELRAEDPEAAQSFERAITCRALLLAAVGDEGAKDVATIVLQSKGTW